MLQLNLIFFYQFFLIKTYHNWIKINNDNFILIKRPIKN